MATSGMTSDVVLLEGAVRRSPLEDAPFHALVDALLESGAKARAARRRANDLRGEGLALLVEGRTRLARLARGELRRSAGSPRTRLISVVRGRSRPRLVGGWGQPTFSDSTQTDNNWLRDRVQVGALDALRLLRRLARASGRPARDE
jgi:hypothetical protein